MSDKELLYIEDAASHQNHLTSKCEAFTEVLEDKKLIKHLEKIEKESEDLFKSLLKLL